ncbi:MAG: hypothetical protein KGH94_04005 [Candidatus Micrarchaeota archaeon]|nr:hypothetical protein [Candidatus Micrarchaeota archaeon]
MKSKERTEAIEISLQFSKEFIAGVGTSGTSEEVSAIEKRAIQVAKANPNLPVRILRRSVNCGKSFGYSHIPAETWDTIFRDNGGASK